jgi:hypothetical protein
MTIIATKDAIARETKRLTPLISNYAHEPAKYKYALSDEECRDIAILARAIHEYKNKQEIKEILEKPVEHPIHSIHDISKEILGVSKPINNLETVLNSFLHSVMPHREISYKKLPEGFSKKISFRGDINDVNRVKFNGEELAPEVSAVHHISMRRADKDARTPGAEVTEGTGGTLEHRIEMAQRNAVRLAKNVGIELRNDLEAMGKNDESYQKSVVHEGKITKKSPER